MTSALMLSALLTLQAQSAPAPALKPHIAVRFQPAPAFQPHFTVRFQPAGRQVARPSDDREIVGGLIVIHKTPADDPKILLSSREPGIGVRHIVPQCCAARTPVTPK